MKFKLFIIRFLSLCYLIALPLINPTQAQELKEAVNKIGINSITFGTGFFVNNEHILTNKHVVYGCSALSVRFPNTNEWVPASIENMAKKEDLAVLKTNKKSSRHAVFALKGSIQKGDWVKISIFRKQTQGLPGNKPISHNVIISDLKSLNKVKRPENGKSIMLNRINMIGLENIGPGDSGSPLLNNNGYIVGVLAGGKKSDITDMVTIQSSSYTSHKTLSAVTLKATTSFLKKHKIDFYNSPEAVSLKDIIVQVKCT